MLKNQSVQDRLEKRLQLALRKKQANVNKACFRVAPARIEPGQLWSLRELKKKATSARPADSSRRTRFAVTLEIERRGRAPKSVHWAPVSVETEYAGPYDVIVPVVQSAIGCSFMIECWNIQESRRRALGRPIGMIHRSIVNSAVMTSEAMSAGTMPKGIRAERGFSSGASVDAIRNRFQARERTAIRNLLKPCP
jgi:hypothetical protein